jgi:hypothetical protein
VVGDARLVDVKSGKQGNVTKSSTEAELVALSDTASRAIHLRNFIIAQGYDIVDARGAYMMCVRVSAQDMTASAMIRAEIWRLKRYVSFMITRRR